MRIFIMSVKKASETSLKGVELLEKTDKLIFMYEEDDAQISIPMYNILSASKAKVEFMGIPKDSYVRYMLFFAGSIAGANEVFLITDDKDLGFLEKMGGFDVHVSANLNPNSESRVRTKRKAPSRMPAVTKKETEIVNEDISEKREVSKTEVKAPEENKELPEGFMNLPKEDEKDVSKEKTEDPKRAGIKRRVKTVGTAETMSNAKGKAKEDEFDMLFAELEAYLDSKKTKDINPKDFILQISNSHKEAAAMGKGFRECLYTNTSKENAVKLDRALAKSFEELSKKIEMLPDAI